nr:hypothetical protein Iba_chr10fCG10060 [Ipomoea batatas]
MLLSESEGYIDERLLRSSACSKSVRLVTLSVYTYIRLAYCALAAGSESALSHGLRRNCCAIKPLKLTRRRYQSISGLVDLDVGQEPGDNPGGGESVMDFFENIGQALLGFQHVLAFPLAGLAVVHQDLDVFQAVHVHFLHLVERLRRLRDLLRASLQGLHAQVERGALVHRQRLVVGQLFHELLDGRGVGRAVRDHHAAVLLPVVHVA